MNTLAVLYCDQPAMLMRHVLTWGTVAYPADLDILVIDADSKIPAIGVVNRTRRHVRVVRLPPAPPWSIGAARNAAFQHAKGDVVAVLDCDQVMEVCAATEFEAYAMPSCRYHLPELMDPTAWISQGLHRHALMARRDDFLALGGYDENQHGYESDHLFVPLRDSALEFAPLSWFQVAHYSDGGCYRWPKTGRFNARTRDTRAFQKLRNVGAAQ